VPGAAEKQNNVTTSNTIIKTIVFFLFIIINPD